MSIEQPAELAGLERAGEVVRETLVTLRAALRPGITTDGSLAAHVEHTLVITYGAPLVLTA